MKRPKPKTYGVKANGRRTRVTVPEDPKPEDVLADALQTNLSPHAVAAMAAFLQGAATKDKDVNRGIHWFADMLIELVGGADEHNRLCEEVGL